MFVLVSGPSGSGKNTIIDGVIKNFNNQVAILPSSTSRTIREGEVEGDKYYYLTKDEFEKAILNKEFIEYKQVHKNGDYYGVHKKRYEEFSKKYPVLIKDIDVEGVMDITSQGYPCVSIYIYIEDENALKERLKKRGEKPEDIKMRLSRKEYEDSFRNKYDYVIDNTDLNKAISDVCEIINKERKK